MALPPTRRRPPTRVRKVFGNTEPPAIEAAEAAAGMTPTRPFSPGTPLSPYDGYSRVPRSQDYTTGYNIAARPRTQERVSFDTLKGMIDAYDVASICIWHRIDSIRALDWSLVPARGFRGDADAAIDVGMAALKKPDRQTPFKAWLAAYLFDVLAYDAGALYRMRNRRGDVIGLRTVDGTTIAPLLDYWGNSPEPPAEAFVQYAQGLPWGWLTRDDLIYEPFRPRNGSPYGTAPLETILLNANTDLRFQVYFLQRFTEGNLPEAFASAPETWSPQQIEQFQEYWDAFMAGDQAAKHQIKWIPGGSEIAWTNEKDFTDHFSLFLMRKTCSAFHVVPSDLGFTESVNRSSGETQADVQHRVGDLPLIAHIQDILTGFLGDDLGLPLQFVWDTGQEKEDRLKLAQAWQIYIKSGMASADEGREEVLGLPGDPARPTPRFFDTNRSGPVPLSAIDGFAGRVDPETFGPARDEQPPQQPFVPAPGVVPAEGTADATASAAAADTYQTQVREHGQSDQPVAKDGGAPTAGITAATGVVGYDLIGADDEDDDEDRAELAKRELVSFKRYRQNRRKAGTWQDFTFAHVDPIRGRRLNQAGRLAVRKAAGEVAVAGLAVQAADTGRVLMLQRALDSEDPAAGTWEMPGGHLEPGETPLQGAWREWAEETGRIPPPGQQTGTWTSADGVYQGIVWQVPSEDCVPITGRGQVSNPDDPDGDCVEAIAWWDPEQLPGNPAVRPELLDSLDAVLAALGQPQDAGGELVKASPDPKGGAPDDGASADWPGWRYDEATAEHWAPRIRDAISGALPARAAQDLAADFLADHQPDGDTGRDVLEAAALAWLARRQINFAAALAPVLAAVHADGYLIGVASAHAVVDGTDVDLGGWKPGDTGTARRLAADLDAADGLDDLDTETTAEEISDSRHRDIARELAGGLLAGATAAAIGRGIRNLLSDLKTAAGVALTEVVRASGIGALFGFGQRGVDEVRWATAAGNICPRCSANADAGAIPRGSPFPSGQASPPAHPRCRCSLEPA